MAKHSHVQCVSLLGVIQHLGAAELPTSKPFHPVLWLHLKREALKLEIVKERH